jgi:flagellar basal-body rod modification protein FlgD
MQTEMARNLQPPTQRQTAAEQPAGDSATETTAAEPRRSGPAISSDFETFVRMLTTQLRNQDPLSPMQSTDFAVQLATFAGVEQQTQTNTLLRDLGGAFGVGSIGALAGWIGMEARTSGPMHFAGAPLELFAQPSAGADRNVLVVSDREGREIGRSEVRVEDGRFVWSGQTGTGQVLPGGVYSLKLESYAKGETLGNSDVEGYATVTEVSSTESGESEVVLSGGVRLPAAAVTALRPPAATDPG